MTISILLADDHVVVRQGLKALLSSQPDFRVVGEASDGLEAVRAVELLRPDVVLLDLMMPGLNGLEVTRRIHNLGRVVVLSMHSSEAYVSEALRSGAYGYVLKDSTTEELVTAVRAVAEGRRYLCAPFSEQQIESYLERTHATPQDPLETLTSREREVLELVARGLSAPEIAEQLTISPRTVEVHRANVMRKLGLKSQAEMIRYAVQHGF
jgi:DNA-binding NarL/FixJ family response regulator